jgi:hypothetical protein
MPLVYPNIPFGLFGAVTAFLIGWTNTEGRPRFEELLTKPRLPRGLDRYATRVGVDSHFHVTYWIFLVAPLIGLRLSFGEPSALVPR